ncbi:MAG: hypothetical protein ABSG21_01040 [Spirochaetia bacterium]|jgi:hypothetical protein
MSRAVVLFSLLLVSCSAGFLDQMGRVLADPSPSPPRVLSFVSEYCIAVTWDPDKAAEEYILERADDSTSPSWSTIYRGTAASYSDRTCADQRRYLYRLSMVRGSRLFGPTEAAVGIGSAACRDLLEPNDQEESATALDYDRAANLYFYRSCSGAVVQDIDWYSVNVPPRRTANIIVTQSGLTGGSVNTSMIFYLKGTAPAVIVNNSVIPIANPSYETRRFLFRISPNPAEFIADPSLAGGSFIDYTVSLFSITSM